MHIMSFCDIPFLWELKHMSVQFMFKETYSKKEGFTQQDSVKPYVLPNILSWVMMQIYMQWCNHNYILKNKAHKGMPFWRYHVFILFFYYSGIFSLDEATRR